MRFKTISLLATACAVAFGALVPAAGAATIGGFGARPAHYDASNPATRAYFIRTVARGGSFTDQVIVSNTEGKPVTLRVYPVDGLTGATSGVVYGNRQDQLHGAGQWVTPSSTEVTVPPRSQIAVGFRVKVPQSANAGQHLAGLALEDIHSGKSPGRFSVTEVLRTVVGIEVAVPGARRSRLSLQSFSIAPIQGTTYPSVVVGLTNAGTNLCKPALSISLNGPGGVQRATRQLDTLLPGDSIPYPFVWPHSLAAGNYTANITATGCGPRVTLHGTASLGAKLVRSTVPPADVRPSSGGSTVPWWPIALVGFGGIVVGALFGRRRRAPNTD
ncbi:MAG: WxL protein peptidoglycan domain-containing protein [Solirubrobacteraceae bacterium]